MNNQAFSFFILILTVGLLQWYSALRDHFGGEEKLKVQVAQLREKLEREKLKSALAAHQLREFRQDVAALLPHEKLKSQSYQVRSLASVVISPATEKFKIESAATLFERGKTRFREGDYEGANNHFAEIIQKHPQSVHIVDSYFLFAEGMYQEGEYEECLKTVETMVNLFPDNDLTGFSLLRMGQILAARDRIEDAEQVYKTVIKNFSNATLVDQAQKLLKEIVL